MPDVGVLQLTIESNASSAGQSLGGLADALSRVKNAVSGGLGLSAVSIELNKFAKSVATAKSTMTVLKTLSEFGNALSKLSKVGSFTVDTESFDKLKSATEGFSIGNLGSQLNQLRQAVSGKWGDGAAVKDMSDLHDAIQAFSGGGDAAALSAFSASVEQYAAAREKMNSAASSSGDWRMSMGGGGNTPQTGRVIPFTLQMFAEKSKDIVASIEQAKDSMSGLLSEITGKTAEATEEFKIYKESLKDADYSKVNPADYLASPLEGLRDRYANLTAVSESYSNSLSASLPKVQALSSDEMIVAGNARQAQAAIEGLISRLNAPIKTKGLSDMINWSLGIGKQPLSAEYSAEVFSAAPVEQFVIALRETGDVVESVVIPRFAEMYQILSQIAYEFGAFMMEGARLASGDSPFLLTNGTTPGRLLLGDGSEPQTFLSTWVQTGEQWKQNWVEFASEAAAEMRAQFKPDWIMGGMSVPQSMQNFALGAGNNPLLLGSGGVSPENALSTWVDLSEQWKQNWSDGSDYMPDWTYFDEGISKATEYEAALERIEQMKATIAEGVANGWLSDEQVESMTRQVEELESRIPVAVEGSVSGMNAAADNVTQSIESAVESTRDLKEEARQAESAFSDILRDNAEAAQIAEQIRAAQEAGFYSVPEPVSMDQTNAMADNLTQLDLLQAQLRDAEGEYNKFVNELGSGATKTIQAGLNVQKLRDAIWEYTEALREAQAAEEESQATGISLSGIWGGLKGGISKLFPTLTSLIGRFQQIAKYRMLRAVMRHITEGFTEGVKNVYQYSAAVGTSLAPAMDAATTSMQQVKNSIGAAAAPLIQAIVPALQTVISWVITAINYLNQFFALLNGQTSWTRALPESSKAFEKTKKAAGGAGKAMKDLLADWDELNVIQSQSGGGGGGGGKVQTEYSKMFEEVSKFDEAVKRVMSFIEDHLGGIAGLLTKLGLALLGWKFSKAFTGILGQIGKLVAGGALLTLGIELAYGGGFEAGKKGFFDTGDLIATIGGTLASAIGGSLITSALGLGGGYGFAIGLTAGIVMSLVGWFEGRKDAADAVKWGNLHKTQEEIEDYVRSQFDFKVVPEIEIMDSHIQNYSKAKRDMNAKILSFNSALEKAHVTVTADVTGEEKVKAVLEAAKEAYSAIESVNTFIDTHKENMTYTLSNIQFTDSEGNIINEELLKSTIELDDAVKTYLTNIGKELMTYIKKGEVEGLSGGEQEAALALMEREKKILALKDQYTKEFDQTIQVRSGMSTVVDRETALAELAREKELIEGWTESARQLVQQDVDGLKEIAAMAEAAAQDALEQGNESAYEELHSKAQKALEEAIAMSTPEGFEAAVEAKLAPTKERLRKIWAETLMSVYGTDISQEIMEGTHPLQDVLFGLWQSESGFSQNLRSAEDKGGFIVRWITAALGDIDHNGTIIDAMQSFGVTLWDLLNESARKNLFMNTADILGSDSKARQAIMSAFGLTYDDIRPYVDNYMEYVKGEVDESAKQKKEELKHELAKGDNPLEFLNLGLGYKAPDDTVNEEVTAHIDNVEVDNVDEVRQSIVEQVDNGKLHISPDIELSNDGQTFLTMMENAINSGKGMDEIKAALQQATDMFGMDAYLEALPYINKLMDEYNKIGTEPTTIAAPDTTPYDETLLRMRQEAFNTATFISNLFSSLSTGGGLSGWVGNVLRSVIVPQQRASGGPVRSGDLVMANENGQFEMMGRMGNQPVVANNQQIVNGISQGVSTANGDVVSELRGLSNLMQKMLNKEFVARAVPSSGWGRNNAQSSEAYDRVRG